MDFLPHLLATLPNNLRQLQIHLQNTIHNISVGLSLVVEVVGEPLKRNGGTTVVGIFA